MLTTNLFGQDLSTHRWENRIVLIISNSQESKVFQDQVLEFKTATKGIAERKIVVYHVVPNQYRFVDYQKDNTTNEWIGSSLLFQKYGDKKSDFNVVLIGLDGSVKLQQNNALTTTKLFTIIDGMPMRKSELKNRKN